ncbi:MAG: 16S rRNA (cytosine(1402)-N(4))-methyltransferase RsmH [Alphaproteobacteria bacterium]|nr:16S rRNA (cytosine(1402)-N(4))-methyltransferase RsmH [Alphaproteobacteria bacterium]
MSAHIPVLLDEVLAALGPCDGGIFVDGTFGRGGYTRAILQAGAARVYAIDQDPDAIAAGRALEASAMGRLVLMEGRFSEMEDLLAAQGIASVDGVVLDIGVSSPQLDDPMRGFSFQADGPLDMRMSRSGPSAADLVNRLSEAELADLIFLYGEERRSRAVARAIVAARAEAPITHTRVLAQIVARAVGKGGPLHPATRTFQALRIAVNHELEELAKALCAAERLLKAAGKLIVVTFHSLEDRVAKLFLTARSGRGPQGSRHLPQGEASLAPSFTLLTRKPVTASARELAINPRARSAKLRAAMRTAAPSHPFDLAFAGLASIGGVA